MRHWIFAALLSLVIADAGPSRAEEAVQDKVQRFLTTISPPGAQISFAVAEESGDIVTVSDVVAHAQSAGGEETVQRIGLMQLRDLVALPSGLFRLDSLRAENIRMDGASDLQGAGPANVRIRTATASEVDGTYIGALAFSGIEISASAAGSAYVVRIAAATLSNVDAQTLTRAAVRAHNDPRSARREDALLNSLLNSNSYGALHIRGASVRKGGTDLLAVGELYSEPDGAYAPFPASGNFFVRNASLDLRDPMAASVRNWLGQERLQFNIESRHKFSAPASHVWDASLTLSPDAKLVGTCSAQNLNGFSPVLMRQAQAASTNPAILRACDLNFTGNEFVNRWLAQDGASQGLSLEEARAKYLAGSVLAPLDPRTANNPLALQLISAGQIFLTQPSRLNIQLAPPGGLRFSDSIATFVTLFQGGSEQQQQAMQRLGMSIKATPLN